MDRDITSPQARTEQGQSSQAQAVFSDSSGPLFHMYIKMTEGEDEKMAHRWQKDADGILIFTGLFSAALAALLTVSVQDLKPNPQDTTAFYLGNIYQLLADPNISHTSILATPVQPPVFSPPKSAVLVNSLWFLSLVVSLTSALLATMLQQWARRFLTITQPPLYSPHKRASIRAFFAHGVERFHLPSSVEALPALLHLSLFLFFTGLAIYLFNINHTVFSVVVWWVVLAGGVYGCITLMPIFWHDSPYYSPLSSSAWIFFNFTFFAIRRIRYFLLNHQWPHPRYLGLSKTVQEYGSELSAEINNRILTWTIQTLEEDKDLEQFFEAIPGFCSSEVVQESGLELDFTKFDETLAEAFSNFCYDTLSSSLFSEGDKKRRVIVCVKAIDAAQLSRTTISTIRTVFNHGVDLLRSVDMWQSLTSSSGDQVPGLCSQGIIAGVITKTSEHDERWEALAKDQLGLSEEVFRSYLENGDSVLLANLIHITRLLFPLCLNEVLDSELSLWNVLSSISEFGIENTLPGLQHNFCDQVVKLQCIE
ncbi:hypothetical protein BGW80DRAFT_1568029 [Lactifluus volemus]|nr:hypothetical protein BGW80DRAFT_1568029 [Lactifluus volemus]